MIDLFQESVIFYNPFENHWGYRLESQALPSGSVVMGIVGPDGWLYRNESAPGALSLDEAVFTIASLSLECSDDSPNDFEIASMKLTEEFLSQYEFGKEVIQEFKAYLEKGYVWD